MTIVQLRQNRNIYKVQFDYNEYYKMTKKDITKKIIGTGVGLALGALSTVNGQDYTEIQKGVNARTVVEETPTHVVFHYGMNKDLQKAIKSSKKPHLYLTGDKNSYMIVDPDTSGFKIYYNQKNFDEGGNGKVPFVVNIKGDEHINPCDENGLGSKTNYLVSFYDIPSRGVSEKPEQPKVVQEVPEQPKEEVVSKEQPSSNYNITNIRNITNTTNNYYGDTTKVKEAQQKLSTLELRALIEGSKNINPLESPFWGATGAIQLGKGPVWAGAYATAGFGEKNTFYSVPVRKTTLLNQDIQLFTETEGLRTQRDKLSYPVEVGGIVSLNSKDNRVRLDLGYGFSNRSISTSDITESGWDWITQNGNVVGERKPYSFTIEEGKNSKNWVQTQKIGLNVQPFKNQGAYVGIEAQHRGKLNSQREKFNINAKLGWMFGGRKR